MAKKLRDGDRVRLRKPLSQCWPGIWVVFGADPYDRDGVRLRKLGSDSMLEACGHEVALCRDNNIVRGLAGQERVAKKNRRLINKIFKEIDSERKD